MLTSFLPLVQLERRPEVAPELEFGLATVFAFEVLFAFVFVFVLVLPSKLVFAVLLAPK